MLRLPIICTNSGAVAFGGLMGDKTGNLIGISETLIVSSVAGNIVTDVINFSIKLMFFFV